MKGNKIFKGSTGGKTGIVVTSPGGVESLIPDQSTVGLMLEESATAITQQINNSLALYNWDAVTPVPPPVGYGALEWLDIETDKKYIIRDEAYIDASVNNAFAASTFYADNKDAEVKAYTDTKSITVSSVAPISMSSFRQNRSFSLNASGVFAGNYINPNISIDSFGRITAASNGSSGGGGITTLTGAITGSGTGTITTTLNYNFTKSLNMGGNKINSLANPVASTDALNLGFADSRYATPNYVINNTQSPLEYIKEITSYNISNPKEQERYRIRCSRSIFIDNNESNVLLENDTFGYLNSNGNTGKTLVPFNVRYDLRAQNKIRASEFNAWSSIKRKNIIDRSEAVVVETTNLFRQLPFVKYEFKDKSAEGNGDYYGVIAEEINLIVPQFVDMEDLDYIPNIMQGAKIVSVDGHKISLQFAETLPLFDSTRVLLRRKGKRIDCQILEKSKDTMLVESEEDIFIFGLDEIVIVYGTYEKCPTVSKIKMLEMAMPVLQGVLKRLEDIEKKLLKQEGKGV